MKTNKLETELFNTLILKRKQAIGQVFKSIELGWDFERIMKSIKKANKGIEPFILILNERDTEIVAFGKEMIKAKNLKELKEIAEKEYKKYEN